MEFWNQGGGGGGCGICIQDLEVKQQQGSCVEGGFCGINVEDKRWEVVTKAIDEVVNRYYHEVVGPFWPPERKLVEKFANLPFPFQKIDPPEFEMTASWNLDHLLGYLRTWSSTQRFIAAKGGDPVDQIADDLRSTWGDPEQTRTVTWPLTMRIGRKPNSTAGL